MKILITGSAGFIGFHLVQFLSDTDFDIVGIDNLNDYYDVNLKLGRLKECGIEDALIKGKKNQSGIYKNYCFVNIDLVDQTLLNELFEIEKFDVVCHLAAQAGVRYSLTNPQAYIDSNIQGFINILENCRHNKIQHLLYASSSSVYGLNKSMPFATRNNVDHPVSLYAATKKSNELMAHTYSHLYGLPTTGLRFFTVYGSWGRPDMAIFLFTKAIVEGRAINVFNNGHMKRDFTHVSDIVMGISKLIPLAPTRELGWDVLHPDPASSSAPYRVYNIGRGKPIALGDFITEIEKALGITADKNLLPLQPGDVEETWADVKELRRFTGYSPQIEVREGVEEFVNWYTTFYNIKSN